MIVVLDAASVNAQLRLHRGYTPDADDGGFRRPTMIFSSSGRSVSAKALMQK
jgi:hypothetical protein